MHIAVSAFCQHVSRSSVISQDLMGFLHYLRETVEPGSSARWLRPPQVQHILNYKACHSAIRCVVSQDLSMEFCSGGLPRDGIRYQ